MTDKPTLPPLALQRAKSGYCLSDLSCSKPLIKGELWPFTFEITECESVARLYWCVYTSGRKIFQQHISNEPMSDTSIEQAKKDIVQWVNENFADGGAIAE